MKIAVFGGTGLVGTKLVAALKQKGDEVLVLDVRRDPDFASKIKDCAAVVNLGGYPLFAKRWNSEIKGLIYDSRVESTHAIVEALRNSQVKVLVNASAIGIYGASETDVDENSPASDDFLARICKAWEFEALGAERQFKIRTVLTRFGIILGKDGGALAQLLPPFKLGAGGPIGSGHQSMSWVHIDDVVAIILHALENEKVSGPINVTSPNIVSNKAFSKALGKVLHRPAFMPLPKLALFVIVGEAAWIIASGQRVLPQAILRSGYSFKHPLIEEALENILKT